MRILFINPPFTKYGGIAGHGGKNTPLNLAYLAAFLRKQRPQSTLSIIDAEGMEISLEELYQKTDAFTPDVIGITCPTPVYAIVKEICTYFKKKDRDIPIFIGGPHPTVLPQQTLADMNADIAFIGESEETIIDVVDALEGKKQLAHIAGIAYKSNNTIYINPQRPLIQDLDSLPFPAKDLLPLEKYYLPPTKRIRSEKATNMITSRGCPFRCTFCMARTIWGQQTRLRSTENVLKEIKENVEKYKLTEFSFHDELFSFRRDRVINICKGIIDKGLDITWVCNVRAGTVDAEMLRLMKQAGCGKIGFGFESGNQRMLNIMNKQETLENAVDSVRLCKDAGIKVAGAFIIGHPGETVASIQDTITFAKKLDIDTASFFIATPYPGTELYEIAEREGLLQKDIEWRNYAPITNLESPMVLPNISPKELKFWLDKAYKSYYLRPKYIIQKLLSFRNYGDIRSICRGIQTYLAVTSK